MIKIKVILRQGHTTFFLNANSFCDNTLSLIIKQYVFKPVQDGNKSLTRLTNLRGGDDHTELLIVLKETAPCL